MATNIDILLVIIPPQYLDKPNIAPAMLKSVVKANGFNCKTMDFALTVYQKIFAKNYVEYTEWANTLKDKYKVENISDKHKVITDQAISLLIEKTKETNPKYIGISVFSQWQHRFTYLFCTRLKAELPHIKIILGGMGCSVTPVGLTQITNLKKVDLFANFGQFMVKQKLTDAVVINDGEIELVKILKGTFHQSFEPNEATIKNSLLPDYDDYYLDDYLYNDNNRKLLVQGSKGCVRQCVFCSEHSNYSKFYFKTGQQIAQQLIELSKKYTIYNFQFTDSLVNGSLKEFKSMCKYLAEYNTANPSKQISWHGNYICRNNKSMSDEDYILLKLSGGHTLTIGAESGSNKVLSEMQKQMTAEDILYEIDKFSEHGIDCALLFMVGFYNETWEDFLDTLRLLKKLHIYFANGTINSVRLGFTLMIDTESNIWHKVSANDFIHDPINAFNWLYKKNPNLTLYERTRRRVIVQEFCDKLEIPVAYANEDLTYLDQIFNNNIALDKDYDNHN